MTKKKNQVWQSIFHIVERSSLTLKIWIRVLLKVCFWKHYHWALEMLKKISFSIFKLMFEIYFLLYHKSICSLLFRFFKDQNMLNWQTFQESYLLHPILHFHSVPLQHFLSPYNLQLTRHSNQESWNHNFQIFWEKKIWIWKKKNIWKVKRMKTKAQEFPQSSLLKPEEILQIAHTRPHPTQTILHQASQTVVILTWRWQRLIQKTQLLKCPHGWSKVLICDFGVHSIA